MTIDSFAVVTTTDDATTLWVEYLGVSRAVRGMGVGQAIMARIEQWGRKAFMSRVGLRALSDGARAFSTRLGYTLELETEDVPADRPRMYKLLPGVDVAVPDVANVRIGKRRRLHPIDGPSRLLAYTLLWGYELFGKQPAETQE